MLQSEKWLRFEDKIRNGLIGKLDYEGVNIWYLIRRRLFELSYSYRRYPKIRRNIFFNRLIFFLYRFSVMLLCKMLVRKRPLSFSKKVLITTRARDWGTIRDLKTGEKKQGEMLYDNIINELSKRHFEPLILYEFPESPHMLLYGLKKLLPRLRNGVLVSTKYWSLRTWVKAYIWSRYFQKIWKTWKFKENLSTEWFKEFKFVLSCYIQFVIEDIEASKKVIDEVEPNLIVSWAWGGFRLALVLAAKKYAISTISYDYATVDEWKYLVNGNSKDVPDKFCVALRNKHDFLLKRGLEPYQVDFTGAPNSDIKNNANKFYDRQQFCKRLHLDSEKKLVLILTGHTSKSHSLVSDSFNALKDEDAEIIIKPHPQDTISEFKAIVGSEATILSPDSDLFEVLYVSDLVIGYYSSAITEGVMFGTPAISVNFESKGDLAPYLSEHTWRVHISELDRAIKKALYNEEAQKELESKVNWFLRENKLDGHATERFVNVIEEMIK